MMQTFGALDNKQKIEGKDFSLKHSLRGRGSLLLHLADTNLVLAQRNAEWCGHGPILEQDIAITNISLDLLGQARNFYQYAALLLSETANNLAAAELNPSINEQPVAYTEDSLAYLRTEREFLNLLITELPKDDWGNTVLRQFFCSVYLYLLYDRLRSGEDEQLAAISEKSFREIAYHVTWSSEWVIRLGDGTEESHQRMLIALGNLWPYTGEFFMPAPYEAADNLGFELNSLHQPWLNKIRAVLEEATLWYPFFGEEPGTGTFMQSGGKMGIHTEHLGFMLAEMQYLQRTYPGANW